MKKQILAWILAVILPLGLLAGCGGNDLPAVYVQTVADLMGYAASGSYNRCAGVVMAQEEVHIELDTSRQIAQLRVEEGQYVEEGAVLFVYDMGNVQLDIDRMLLEIEQLNNSITDMTNQIKQLEEEKKKAAENDRLAYTLQIQSLETDVKEAQYNVSIKKRDVQNLQNNTDTGEVRSPISGEIKSLNKNGGYDSFTGQPLPFITLVRNDAFRVKGVVNELNRDEFYVGQNVIIRSRVDSTKSWMGVVRVMETEPSNEDNYYYGYYDEMTSSSSYPFYVDPLTSDGMLLGQHVFIEPDRGQAMLANGFYLNASYICGSLETGFYVWAANSKDCIEKRYLELGALDEGLDAYEVISGLYLTDSIAFPGDDPQAGAPVIRTERPSDHEEDPWGGMDEDYEDTEDPNDTDDTDDTDEVPLDTGFADWSDSEGGGEEMLPEAGGDTDAT